MVEDPEKVRSDDARWRRDDPAISVQGASVINLAVVSLGNDKCSQKMNGRRIPAKRCSIKLSMLHRLGWVAIVCALAGAAQASPLRVSAEPPLSGERLGDALRSYVDGADVTIEPPARDSARPIEPGTVVITLQKSRALGEDAEVVLIDGEETIVARLPGALRTEDLYRAAALKVQALLQRRVAAAPAAAGVLIARAAPSAPPDRGAFLLAVDLAMLVPTSGPVREALRLAAGLQLGQRWRLDLGTYLEPRQTADAQGIQVTAWEIPVCLSLGFAWHTGVWQGWLEGVGQAALRKLSAEAAGVVSNSDTTVSPRAGGALGIAMALAPGLRAHARASALAVLADARYRVDGQVVWPAARALVLVELGLQYGGR